MKTQEQLFNEWKEQCIKLQNLNCFFQNDLKRLYDDELTTVEDIQTLKDEFSELYVDAKDKLEKLFREVYTYHINFILYAKTGDKKFLSEEDEQ